MGVKGALPEKRWVLRGQNREGKKELGVNKTKYILLIYKNITSKLNIL
jgi:hypothetical protein